LLTLSEVPSAWSVDKTLSGTSPGAGSVATPSCLKNLTALNPVGVINRAEVKFRGSSSGIPVFEEQLASFVPGSLEDRLPAYDRAIAGCGPISYTAAGYTFTGSIRPMSFPTVGDESRAYQWNVSTKVSGQSVSIGFDVVLARRGDTAVALLTGDFPAPDVSTFQRLVAKAVSRVSNAAYV